MSTPEQLFEKVVAASRLNRMIAPYTISRLLLRANVSPKGLTPDGLARALPELEQGLRIYLASDDVQEAMRALRTLAARR